MRHTPIRLLFIICSLLFTVGAWAQSNDIEVTDSTSTEWGGGTGGGGLNPQTPNDPVTELNISKTSVTLEGGESVRLVATVNQQAGNKKILWSSANSTIASVDANGTVLGLTKGQTVVTATAEGNTNLEATCLVTVTSTYEGMLLPAVPFEFCYSAADYNETTHSIPNHPRANLSGYSLQLTESIPQFVNNNMLSIDNRCEGYIDRWDKWSNESGTYFYRKGQDCMTIVAKVVPRLGTGNASDFVSNRGNNYNYMWRIGDGDRMFLHTGWAYDENRSLVLSDESPQVLAVRVNGPENYILLQNLTTGESLKVDDVGWSGGDNVFKLFYNNEGEYWLGDFYWVYYSFELLTDEQMKVFTWTAPTPDDNEVTLKLKSGWNWVSQPYQQAVDAVSVAGGKGQRILSQTQELVNDPVYGWVGNLQALEANSCYKIQMKSDHSYTLPQGDVYSKVIQLAKGWNWVGYPHTFTSSLPNALAPTEVKEGDVIFCQGGMAYYTDNQWFFTQPLDSMRPGTGYLYKSVDRKPLVYNPYSDAPSTARQLTGNGGRPSSVPMRMPDSWQNVSSHYSSQMAVIGLLVVDGQPVAPRPVAAFCGEECRGVSSAVNGRVFLCISGEVGDVITLRVLSEDGVEEQPLSLTLTFDADVHGTPADPVLLVVNQEETAIANVAAPALRQSPSYDVDGRRARSVTRPAIHITNGRKQIVKP